MLLAIRLGVRDIHVLATVYSATLFALPVAWMIAAFLALSAFFHLLVILPVLGWVETPKPLPASISQPVMKAAE